MLATHVHACILATQVHLHCVSPASYSEPWSMSLLGSFECLLSCWTGETTLSESQPHLCWCPLHWDVGLPHLNRWRQEDTEHKGRYWLLTWTTEMSCRTTVMVGQECLHDSGGWYGGELCNLYVCHQLSCSHSEASQVEKCQDQARLAYHQAPIGQDQPRE